MTPSTEPHANGVDPKTVAFYLPQFHPIPENDEWWGQGFTEWVNVRRAIPLFDGHHQPAEPVGPFGEYTLTDPRVIEWQVDLATQNGIDAFCYYHYWFDGKRLLERPLNQYLQTSLQMPFLICWANENWSRRWDGKDQEVLLAQRYDDSTASAVFESFLPYLRDSRYLRVDGRAVLLVHRIDHIPNAKDYAETWRALAASAGIGELWLVASETTPGLDPRDFGFDAVAEFPPVGDSNLKTTLLHPPSRLDPAFRGRLLSYERMSSSYLRRSTPPFPRHRGLVPRWDNTPRRMTKSTVILGSSPELYAKWLAAARASERALRPDGGIVFVNAWNEWAEGAYLEPDRAFGDRYLKATRWNYAGAPSTRMTKTGRRRVTRSFISSIAMATVATVRDVVLDLRSRVERLWRRGW